MKRLNIYIGALMMVALAFAQKQVPPAGGVPKDFKLPAKTTFALDNGLQVVMVPYGSIPKVAVRVVVKSGNGNEKAGQVWLSDLTADLMKEGTTTKSAQDVSLAAANMGGQINLSVRLNQTFAGGEVLSEFGPELVKLLADVVLNPALPEGEIARLKADMKRSLSVQLSRPQALANEKFSAMMYGEDTPYGDVYPTEEMIDSYTLADIKAFYSDNFGAKRTTVYVAGVFDEATMKKVITEAFSNWKPGTPMQFNVPQLSAKPGVEVMDRPGAPQSTIMMGLPVVGPKHEDYMALSVTNYLLGGSFASRITSNIREDKGYTYSPHSSIDENYGTAVWYEEADVTTSVTGPSLKEISYEINRLRNEAPTKEELDGIKNYRAGIFVLQNSSPSGIVGQLAYLDLHGLDESFLTNYVKNIMAVTPEQVKEMTDKYLDYENMTIVVVGDKKEIEKQIEAYQNEIEKF